MAESIKIIIYPTHEMTPIGRHYVAVYHDKIIAEHFCTNDEFAKRDLGYYDNELDTLSFGRLRRKEYLAIFPDGFSVEFSDIIYKL